MNFVDNILWFRSIRKNDIPKVGGKGANLGEMINRNFPIPNGFVVTAQAYFEYIESTGIKDTILQIIDSVDVDKTDELERATQQVRQIILKTDMSDELKADIMKNYMKLGEHNIGVGFLKGMNEEFVAIRSSATAEDLPEASFAGQQETYLNIKGKQDVVQTVKKCWASLFTPRATYYRAKQGFKTEKVGIAVVVQRMVNSESSGVMFTADPSTGDTTKIIIEGGLGLGEAVVSGSITPDNFVVEDKTFKILEKKIQPQKWKIIRKGKDNVKIDLTEEEMRTQKISDEYITELAKIGKKIEQAYEMPQDIEWALEKGELYIVQSRAITTLKAQEKAKEKDIGELQVEGQKPIIQGLGASPGIVTGQVKVVPEIRDITKVQPGDILVTKMTSPDWVPVMKKSKAIITDEGGRTCHAAIVSRELGIPCIVGTQVGSQQLKDNQTVTIDGYNGNVYQGEIAIKKPEKAEAKEELVKEEEMQELATGLKSQAEEYGEKIEFSEEPLGDIEEEKERLIDFLKKIATKVKVNVALTEAAENASKTNADGVGLLRAEHMITAKGKHPAQYLREGKYDELVAVCKEGIKKVATLFPGKPVWYRTFDARTDEFRNLEGGEHEPHEDNPMLGWHGIRRDLDQPDLLKAQFQAIKELRDEGIKNVGVMLPFVISPFEVEKSKEIMKQVGLDPLAPDFEFGVMIETPAAVMIARKLFRTGIKFISFGTNDLTQLTLGIDRNNERIQKHFSELHPAIQKMIKRTIKRAIEQNVTTSICGQAGSNPEMVKKLVRYGIDSISANIDAVEQIKKIVLLEEKKMILEKLHKKRVRSLL